MAQTFILLNRQDQGRKGGGNKIQRPEFSLYIALVKKVSKRVWK